VVQVKRNASQDVPFSSGRFSDEFLDETIRVWQPKYPDRMLTRDDAREIIASMTGFFNVLAEWGLNEREN
jgi:hypothetical protein